MGYLIEKRKVISTRPGPNGVPEPAWLRAPERSRQSKIKHREGANK